MFTREEFVQKAIEASIAKYPSVAALVKAGDPRVMQQIEAMATMMEMYSAQLEVAQAEPFEKSRDSTVMADAAMRGLIPKAVPASVEVQVNNASTLAVEVAQGRSLMDSQGRLYRADTSVTVEAGGSGTFVAVQLYAKEQVHTVAGSRPFYEIPVALADDDSHLCGLSVRDSSGAYEYRERYVNTAAGEKVYHLEVDERRRVYVRFGQDGVVGTQPIDGADITLTGFYSMGAVDFAAGEQLVFEAIQAPVESQVEMKITALLAAGQNPPTMQTLRELARYPSVYNHNAVFLGEFDFLVRRHFPALRFLSVWNEQVEESVRGMHLDNINALFVACLSESGAETVLEETATTGPVAPIEFTELTATMQQIKAKIEAADDSYRVRFYSAIKREIPVQVTATVASSYDESVVASQIRAAILERFGETAPQSRRGHSTPLYQQIYQIIRGKVPALSVGRADLRVVIEESALADPRPELWRYVSEASLQVGVTAGNVVTPYWGSGL
jgi:hypothetical protein